MLFLADGLMRGGLERWRPCDSRGNSLACAANNCQRIRVTDNTDLKSRFISVLSVAYFFRVAAAFFAERERAAAERFFSALRA